MSASARMSAIDTAWLRMERRTNPMTIVSVTILAEPCTLAAYRRMLAACLLRFDRFRRVPRQDAVGGLWVDDPYFELEAHVGEIELPGEGTQADLERLVGELVATPLDPSRPRWRFDLVPHYRGGSVSIMRMHHCYADGIALVKLFLGMTSTDPAHDPVGDVAPRHVHGDDRSLPWLRGLSGPAADFVADVVHGSQELVEAALHGLRHPLDALGEAQKTASDVGGVAGELAALLALPDDPPTPLRGELGARRRVAWIPPLPLREVRTVGRALGATINDVLLSVVAGALGRYLREIGTDTTGLVIRATVPVNLRPADEEMRLGNRFGLVLLGLPVGLDHPLERLHAVRASMQALKGSRQPAATFAVLNALGRLPEALEQLAIDTLSRKATAVISNVPGPRQRLYLCGKPIAEMYFWVPQSGSIGLGISILTYVDEVLFGLVADRRLVPDPHRVIDLFDAEFERLALLTVLGAAHARPPRLPASRVRARAVPGGAGATRQAPARARKPSPAVAAPPAPEGAARAASRRAKPAPRTAGRGRRGPPAS